jgi:hypothetical protein
MKVGDVEAETVVVGGAAGKTYEVSTNMRRTTKNSTRQRRSWK